MGVGDLEDNEDKETEMKGMYKSRGLEALEVGFDRRLVDGTMRVKGETKERERRKVGPHDPVVGLLMSPCGERERLVLGDCRGLLCDGWNGMECGLTDEQLRVDTETTGKLIQV